MGIEHNHSRYFLTGNNFTKDSQKYLFPNLFCNQRVVVRTTLTDAYVVDLYHFELC